MEEVFQSLPRKCILLLEDIDCVGVKRKPSFETSANDVRQTGNTATGLRSHRPAAHGAKISLSGILNAIDGASSPEGRLLIMTRVDRVIQFAQLDKQNLERMFLAMYPSAAIIHPTTLGQGAGHGLSFPEMERTEKTTQGDLEQHIAEMDRLASDFATTLPSGIFTAAEIQGYLISSKRAPGTAVEKFSSWLASRCINGEADNEAKVEPPIMSSSHEISGEA